MNEEMRTIAEEITNIKIKGKTTRKLLNEFFEIMRKHGIKQSIKIEHKDHTISYAGNTFEWTMASDFFAEHIKDEIYWQVAFFAPEDLQVY